MMDSIALSRVEVWQSGLMQRSYKSPDLTRVSRVRTPSPPQKLSTDILYICKKSYNIKIPLSGHEAIHAGHKARDQCLSLRFFQELENLKVDSIFSNSEFCIRKRTLIRYSPPFQGGCIVSMYSILNQTKSPARGFLCLYSLSLNGIVTHSPCSTCFSHFICVLRKSNSIFNG